MWSAFHYHSRRRALLLRKKIRKCKMLTKIRVRRKTGSSTGVAKSVHIYSSFYWNWSMTINPQFLFNPCSNTKGKIIPAGEFPTAGLYPRGGMFPSMFLVTQELWGSGHAKTFTLRPCRTSEAWENNHCKIEFKSIWGKVAAELQDCSFGFRQSKLEVGWSLWMREREQEGK